MSASSWRLTGCCFYKWEAPTPACTCVRRWSMDTCTPYCESPFTSWEARGWSRRSTGPTARLRNPPSAATPLQPACWAQASAQGPWRRPQGPIPGSGTKISSSWSATETHREWKNIAREFGAPAKNTRRPNADILWVGRREEGKGEQTRTPTGPPDTPWAPKENTHWPILLLHTNTHMVQRSDSWCATCFNSAVNMSCRKRPAGHLCPAVTSFIILYLDFSL